MGTPMGILIVTIVVAMAAAPADAQRRHVSEVPGDTENPLSIAALQLTAEQKREAGVLWEGYRREAAPLQERLSLKRAQMRSLWLERSPDQAKIGAAQHERDVLRSRLREMNRDYHRRLNEMLTPEQRETLRAQARPGRSHGSGPNSGGGYGPGMGMKGKR